MNKWIAFSFVMLMTVASAQASLSTLKISGQMDIISIPADDFVWTSDWVGHSRVFATQAIPDPWLSDTDVDEEDADATTSATASVGANYGKAHTTLLDMESEAYVEPPPGYAALVQSGASLFRNFCLSGLDDGEVDEVVFGFEIQLSGESFTDALGDYANATGGVSVTIGKHLDLTAGTFEILDFDNYSIDWTVNDGAIYGPWSYTGKLIASATLGPEDLGFVKFGMSSTVGAYTVPTPSAVVLCIVGLSSVGWLPKRRIF